MRNLQTECAQAAQLNITEKVTEVKAGLGGRLTAPRLSVPRGVLKGQLWMEVGRFER